MIRPFLASAALSIPLFLPALLPAAVIEDFSTTSTPTVYRGDERGASCAVAAAPDGARSATPAASLVLHLDATHHPLQEVYFTPMRPLPGPGVVTMRVLVPEGWQGLGLSLRVRDGKGEVFQFKPQPPVTLAAGTWSEVRFTVDEEHIQGHWGPDGSTGHLTGAWSLAGLACSIGPTGVADLWFDDIAFTAAP